MLRKRIAVRMPCPRSPAVTVSAAGEGEKNPFTQYQPLLGYSGAGFAFQRDGLVTIVSLIDYSGLVVQSSAHACGWCGVCSEP